MSVLDKETARELSASMLTSITIQNGIHLADRKRAPGIAFYEDEQQFFDSNEYKIHLGIYGPTEYFKVETNEDYIAGVEYLYGHENQHVRSTANVPYTNGIKRSVREIIKYIANKEGIRKNFRNDKDYEVFLKKELPASKNINVNFQTIMSICGMLFNSIEDGRIERIRALEFPGFEKERRYFRAIVWNQEQEYKPLSAKLNDNDKLNILISCIHSLATTGLYPKGFIAAYGSSALMKEVYAFMPYIGKAVLSGRTRDMADNVVEIAKLLAPYIYSVCKYNPTQAEQMLQQLLSRMLSQLISNMDMDSISPTSEKDEETDDGMPMSVFPMSDLVVTLDDETYDKLMEKMKDKKSGNGGGIMVQREHPKDEDQDGKDSEGGNGKGCQKSKDKKNQNDSGSGSGKKGEEDEQDNSNGSSNGDAQKDSDKKGNSSGSEQDSSSQSNSSENGDSSNPSSSENSNSSSSSKEYQVGDGAAQKDTKSNNGNHSAGGGRTGSVEMVEEQMKKAAAECREDVTDLMTNINQAVEHSSKTNRGGAPICENKDKTVTKEDVKNIIGARGFEEKRREYKLSEKLPPILNARAKSFRKKNERYFRSLSTPNVSHLDSGNVDPSLIFNLAIGDTEVFRKIGQDKKFNGCVYVLVDNSGSMSGNKRTEAAKAAAVIEEGFKGIIPMKIVAFDTCGPVIHEVIKGWDESQKLNCCWNFVKHGRNGCGNDDSYDILIAQKELLSRPEEKKLLIVLSDGAPASIEDTKKAIQDTRKKGIDVFGIYFEEGRIGSDAKEFQYMYVKDYVCCELAEVDEQLTKLMIKFSRS